MDLTIHRYRRHLTTLSRTRDAQARRRMSPDAHIICATADCSTLTVARVIDPSTIVLYNYTYAMPTSSQQYLRSLPPRYLIVTSQ